MERKLVVYFFPNKFVDVELVVGGLSVRYEGKNKKYTKEYNENFPQKRQMPVKLFLKVSQLFIKKLQNDYYNRIYQKTSKI